MIGLERCEERDLADCSWCEAKRKGLERRQRELVLVPPVRQARPTERADDAGGAVREPVELEPIGEEAGGSVEAAVHDPGMRLALALWQVLA